MDRGLVIGLDEFNALPQKQQLGTLYQNQVKQFERFDTIEKIMKGYKMNQKIQYVWLTTISGVGFWIMNKYGSLVIPIFMFLFLI